QVEKANSGNTLAVEFTRQEAGIKITFYEREQRNGAAHNREICSATADMGDAGAAVLALYEKNALSLEIGENNGVTMLYFFVEMDRFRLRLNDEASYIA
ncbi:MAG: hypothetical protein QXW10_03000, partial [Candidatus Micrarchaeaceae archaeon]